MMPQHADKRREQIVYEQIDFSKPKVDNNTIK